MNLQLRGSASPLHPFRFLNSCNALNICTFYEPSHLLSLAFSCEADRLVVIDNNWMYVCHIMCCAQFKQCTDLLGYFDFGFMCIKFRFMIFNENKGYLLDVPITAQRDTTHVWGTTDELIPRDFLPSSQFDIFSNHCKVMWSPLKITCPYMRFSVLIASMAEQVVVLGCLYVSHKKCLWIGSSWNLWTFLDLPRMQVLCAFTPLSFLF